MCKTLNHSENDDQQFLMHLQRFGENKLLTTVLSDRFIIWAEPVQSQIACCKLHLSRQLKKISDLT